MPSLPRIAFGWLIAALLVSLLASPLPARADESSDNPEVCNTPPGPNGVDALITAMQKIENCKAVAEQYEACRWGSSADTYSAPVAVERCERDFVPKLTKAEMKNYADRMQLCAYLYSKTQGTLFMSEAASCQVDVAARFAADPSLASKPLGRASFDCAKAASPIERTICAAPELGFADIALNQTYQDMINGLEGDDKKQMAADERNWLKEIVARCQPDGSAAPDKVACLRSAFETRFTAMNQCEPAGWTADCVRGYEEDAAPEPPAPRASFDCAKPATPVEIVICADADLGKADLALNAAYKQVLSDADPQLHRQLVDSERAWLQFVNATCPLGAIGGIPPLAARSCVEAAFETRTAQLSDCQKNTGDRGACLFQFSVLPPEKKE